MIDIDPLSLLLGAVIGGCAVYLAAERLVRAAIKMRHEARAAREYHDMQSNALMHCVHAMIQERISRAK